MPCYYPVRAYMSLTPGQGVTFKRGSHSGAAVDLPCGQCIGCRLERSQSWAIRMMHEAQCHKENAFLTLTYSDEKLPRDYSLDKSHFQKFMKRYRKAVGVPLRFFHCGEYGDQTGRPHYHAAIFGHDFKDKIKFKQNKQGDWLYVSEQLDKLWGFGHCIIGELTYQSAGYIARYVMKKVTGERAKEHYQWLDEHTGEIIDREPEYVTMSNRPGGIGYKWFQKFREDVLPCDFVALPNGSTAKTPGYYMRLLERENPELYKSVKKKRAKRAKEMKGEQDYYRLVARETVKKAQVSQLRREL